MVIARPARLGKRLALGLGAAAIFLLATVSLLPSFRERLREEWHLWRLHSAELQTRADAGAALLRMRSERGWVQMLRDPQPAHALLFTRDPLRALQELDPDALDRVLGQAVAQGDLSEAETVRACNLTIPSWNQAMEDRGLESPARELRSLEDLPQLIDALRRLRPRLISSRSAPHPRTSSPGRSR